MPRTKCNTTRLKSRPKGVDMEYKRILSTLKRYKFSEKMRIAHSFSKQVMTPTGLVDIETLRERILPWELETFVLFSVMANEWKSDDFTLRNLKVFYNIIESIRNFRHPELEHPPAPLDFGDLFLLATGAVQFDIQEYYPYKLYRYKYYFTFSNDKIDMRALFQSKFGCGYEDFLAFTHFLWMVESSDATLGKSAFDYLIEKYWIAVSNLCISREDYQRELNDITIHDEDYLYCLRPSYTYPFIRKDDTFYLPLPHLLIRSVTSSLLFRLSDGDNALAELIGKEVLESYLYKIIAESNTFDEVISEKIYFEKKKEQRTLDVMARKGDSYVFFDSKYYAPRRDLRIFSESSFQNAVDRLAKQVKQAYLHIHDRFPAQYNFFEHQGNVSKDNIFGLVVVRENPYVRLKHIFVKAAELLEIPLESKEYIWLCKHIGIVSVYEIERFCFTGNNMIEALQANSLEGHMYDFWLSSSIDKRKTIAADVTNFIEWLKETNMATARHLTELNLLQ